MAPGSQPSLPPAPLPGWLGSAVQVTTQVGVPTVFAAVLLWFLLTRMDTTMRVIQTEEENRTKIVAAMQDTLVATLDRQTKSFEDAIKENIRANRELFLGTQHPPRPAH